MDLTLVHQPKHHWRIFDMIEQSKKMALVIDGYDEIPLVTLKKAIEPLKFHVFQLDDMMQLVQDNCQQSIDNLSIDESSSIMLYTIEWITKETSFCYIFNQKLNSNNIQPWYLYLKLFNTSLLKISPTSSGIFYHGMKFDLEQEYSNNQIFFWHEFFSCLPSIDRLDQEEKCFGRDGRNITKHSFYPTKREILIPFNQRFQVVSNQKTKDNLRILILKDLSLYPSTTISSIQLKRSLNLLIQKTSTHGEINLRNLNLTDDYMKMIIKEVLRIKQCTWLSLQSNQITSYGVSLLAIELKTNTSLESLYLSQNLITDIGVEYLTTSLSNRFSRLTILTLDHNSIRDEGVQYIAEFLENNQILTDLWL
ncbi:hypothetical protein I4U23_019756 [Adineta vaga]|nr:hypothetical protein I4U23_019756 [Adineta vaga]